MASSDTDAHEPGKAGARSAWRHWLSHPRESVPTVAVATVAVTAVLTAVMVTRAERQAQQVQSSVPQPAVAQAPQAPPPARPDAPATMRLGAGPACGNCGVIESVAMRSPHGGYRMRIRMDDGSVRTVEQRDALLAGSRVVLEGRAVRVLPGSPQG